MTARLARLIPVCLLLGGCHKEISSLDRKEAANVVSEGQFAVTLKDWARAEDLYKKATTLCPDTGDYWMTLGIVRMHKGDRGGAREAYKEALKVFKSEEGTAGRDADPVIREAYALVVLGRPDEARAVIAKAHAKHPEDRHVANFFEEHTLEKAIADPGLKELSP